MNELTWKLRRGVHIGKVLGGTINTERERQMSQRTYFIARGEGYGPTDLKSKFYIIFRDEGPRYAVGLPFNTLRAAKAFAQQHLLREIPKIKLEFTGRDSRGRLSWKEVSPTGSGGNFSTNFTMAPEEFYAGMVK